MTRRMLLFVSVYLIAYFAAGFVDLGTTAVALRRAGTHEGNSFVTHGAAYENAVAWLITCGGALVMAGCVVFALRYASRVNEYWLQHPVRSFANVYVNPWSKAVLGFSPLHMLSFALAFVVSRLLAGVNNMMTAAYGVAPIGAPIEWIAHRTSPLAGFAVVIFPAFYLLAIAVSPVAVRVLRAEQEASMPRPWFDTSP